MGDEVRSGAVDARKGVKAAYAAWEDKDRAAHMGGEGRAGSGHVGEGRLTEGGNS